MIDRSVAFDKNVALQSIKEVFSLCGETWFAVGNILCETVSNKKSRIYGTSDRSDLSIYLSALLKSASNVRTFEADSASNVQVSVSQ